ncbi:excinuclease ABC subunit C [bacterium]|nr:excinuclease ABC subunit C [bacterium]
MQEKLKFVPQKPGVYLLRDRQQKILYVGKAKKLRNRLRSHFNPGKDEEPRHRRLMSRVVDFETILTDSEVEALIMEANFVKQHRPRYNVNLKDDKSFPYIRVTREMIPRIFVTRKIIRDGSRYFGPYTDVGSMRQLMHAIKRIFPVRTCNLHIDEKSVVSKKHRVCLMYHIGRCRGPCQGLISPEAYQWIVDQVVAFIEGKNDRLIHDLEARMHTLAAERKYEEAAALRDQIHSVSTFYARQKVVDGFEIERDLLAVAVSGPAAVGVVFIVRDGKIINRLQFPLENADESTEAEVLSSLIKQYYLRTEFVPDEVFLSSPIEDEAGIVTWLSERKGRGVIVTQPVRGKKARLMDMCRKNARLLLDEMLLQKEHVGYRIAPSVAALQKDLGLENPPIHIEAFDNSNIQGSDPVASMVVFENGRPKKSAYRKYKIKTVTGPDDFASMAEILERRLSRLLKEGQPLPDLILVDGGKGQLNATVSVLKKFELTDQPVIGLAKRLEEVFVPGFADAQMLPKSSPSLYLLQRVRDEAHRFAITFHRSLRRKRQVHSVLDDIPGIGEARRRALLKAFGSVNKIQRATVDEIASVRGMNRRAAEMVADALQKNKKEPVI